MSFCWATNTPVLDICLMSPLGNTCRGVYDVHFLKFPSGGTPANPFDGQHTRVSAEVGCRIWLPDIKMLTAVLKSSIQVTSSTCLHWAVSFYWHPFTLWSWSSSWNSVVSLRKSIGNSSLNIFFKLFFKIFLRIVKIIAPHSLHCIVI